MQEGVVTFRRLNVHIVLFCFLQETHFKNSDQARLCKKWIGQVYHSKFLSKSWGVAIIIRSVFCFLPPVVKAIFKRKAKEW